MDPVSFLHNVWELQMDTMDRNQYGFLSYRDEDQWWQSAVYHMKEGIPKELPNDGKNLYFCPNLFSRGMRRMEVVCNSCWLYADLDEVDPRALSSFDVYPTVAWETSPGRYQCMWECLSMLPPELHMKLNQRMTYFTGADKGGWGLSKVLRLPGTVSLKYEEPFEVDLLWEDGPRYSARSLVHILKDVQVGPVLFTPKNLELPDVTKEYVMLKHDLPLRAKRLLTAKTATGDRSARLWQLESLMLEAGVTPEEVLVAVRDTPWNKYAGQRREIPQLWREICKHRVAKREGETNGTPKHASGTTRRRKSMRGDLLSVDDLLSLNVLEVGWLVDSIWSDKAHGIIAGEAKTYKSTLALDLGISVASGTKFLGHFKTPKKGPVVYINSENPEWMMKDRIIRICESRGLFPQAQFNGNGEVTIPQTTLPFYLKNTSRFSLSDEDDLNWLAEITQTMKPELIVLDPWYKMTSDVNENVAAEVNPILKNLSQIKDLGTGLVIIHHYKKQSAQLPVKGGARISGTSLFHRWLESALYVERGEKVGEVTLSTEQRMALPLSEVALRFSMRGDYDYEVDVDVAEPDMTFEDKIAEMVVVKPFTVTELAQKMGVSRFKVKTTVERSDLLTFGKARSGQGGGRPSPVIELVS